MWRKARRGISRSPRKRPPSWPSVIYNALEAIRIVALYMAPLMPNTSAEVFRRLSLGDIAAVKDIEAATAWGQLPAGNHVEIGDPLFPRLDLDVVDLSME